MPRRLRLGQEDRDVAYAVLRIDDRKRWNSVSAAAALFAENIAQYNIAATQEVGRMIILINFAWKAIGAMCMYVLVKCNSD